MSKGVKIYAELGSTTLKVKDILKFEKGSVIDLGVPAGQNVKCFIGNNFLFNAEVMVLEKNLGIRIVSDKKPPLIQKYETQEIPVEKEMNLKENFNFLNKINSKSLANLIQSEHPQTIALILSYIHSGVLAKEVLELFPQELKIEVLIRMLKLKSVSDIVVQKVSDSLELKYKLIEESIKIDGITVVSEILRDFDEKERKEIFNKISEVDQELSESIQKNI